MVMDMNTTTRTTRRTIIRSGPGWIVTPASGVVPGDVILLNDGTRRVVLGRGHTASRRMDRVILATDNGVEVSDFAPPARVRIEA